MDNTNLDEFYRKYALPMALMQMAQGVLQPAPRGGSPFGQIAGGIMGGAGTYMEMLSQQAQSQRQQELLRMQREREKREQAQAQIGQEKWDIEKKGWAEPTTTRTFTGAEEPPVSMPSVGQGITPLQFRPYGVETTTTPGGILRQEKEADVAYKKVQTGKALAGEKPKITGHTTPVGGKPFYTYEGGEPSMTEAYQKPVEEKEPSYSKVEGEVFVKWVEGKSLSKQEQQIINNKFAKEGRETPAEVSAKTKARWTAKIETAEQVLGRKLSDKEKINMFVSDPYGLLAPEETKKRYQIIEVK